MREHPETNEQHNITPQESYDYCAAGATLRTAKPRRSAEGARLDGFLAEEGPIRVPNLSHFETVCALSSAQSGSHEPPDRAQICPCDVVGRV